MKDKAKKRSVIEQVILDLGGTVISLEKKGKNKTMMSVEHGFEYKNKNHE